MMSGVYASYTPLLHLTVKIEPASYSKVIIWHLNTLQLQQHIDSMDGHLAIIATTHGTMDRLIIAMTLYSHFLFIF